jgi:hypothetical protein
MPEYGLDGQSRRSKSCVVNDGSLSTEVLRVGIGYRGTRSKLFRFLFRSTRMAWEPRRRARQGSRRTNNRAHLSQYFPVAWPQLHRDILQVLHLNISQGPHQGATVVFGTRNYNVVEVGWTTIGALSEVWVGGRRALALTVKSISVRWDRGPVLRWI